MKKITTTIGLLCVAILAMAQIYKGNIKDTSNKPVPFANIVLYSLPDSVFVTGTTTNDLGVFFLKTEKKITEGYLEISSIGYTTVNCIAKQNIGTIVLKENINELGEVTISASRISRNARGYSLNLTNEGIVKGKQTSEALMFLPGVTKENGGFKINGLPVSEIYINGVKIQNQKELDNIPGGYLAKAKVEYLAGSESNASLSGGIIRLTTKTPKEGGFYGNLIFSSGFQPSYGYGNLGIGATINYKYKKWSIFNNFNISNSISEERIAITQKNGSQKTILKTNENTDIKRDDLYNRLSINYDINEKQSLGLGIYVGIKNNENKSKFNYSIPENILSKGTKLDNKSGQIQATLSYNALLNKKGVKLSVVGDYLHNTIDNENKIWVIDDSETRHTQNSVDLYKVDASVKAPVSKNLSLKGGGTVNLSKTYFSPENNANYERFVSLSEAKMKGFSPLVYLSATGKIGKLRYDVGVNLQKNEIRYSDINTGIEVENNQTGFSPNVQLMYLLNANKGHMLMAIYKQTMDNIPYDAINPNEIWYDTYSCTKGNPNLKAPKSNIGMLIFSLFQNKLNLTGVYAKAKNTIYYQTFQDDNTQVLYTQPINLTNSYFYGYGIETNLKPLEWWRLKLSGRQEFHKENTTLNLTYFNARHSRFYFTINNNFNFKKNLGATLSAVVEPTYKSYDRRYNGVYTISGSLYKSLFNKRLNVALNFVALGKRRKLERYSKEYSLVENNKTDVQRINLSLTWFFKGGKKVNVKSIETNQGYKEIRDNK